MTLGNYTHALQKRLNHEALQNDENDFIKIYDGCLNEYLMNHDNHFLDSFIATAEGDYLDLHGDFFGLKRRDGESDDDFRNRILLDEFIVQSTSDFMKLKIDLWVYREGFVDDKNVLTTRNPYLKSLHDGNYVFIVTGSDLNYIQSKFLLNDILFVE